MSRFPERLRTLRKKKGITQVQLSKYLNYGYTAIANYESGRNEPSYDVILKIADYFGVTVDYLLGRDELSVGNNSITPEEAELLECFRSLDKDIQEGIYNMIKTISKK